MNGHPPDRATRAKQRALDMALDEIEMGGVPPCDDESGERESAPDMGSQDEDNPLRR